MIAAIWRAVAKVLAYGRWSEQERLHAIKAAEHVEEMLRLTKKLWAL